MSARYAVTCLIASVIVGGCNPRPAANSMADLTPPDPEPEVSTAPTEMAPSLLPPEIFRGRWFVNAVYPVGSPDASMGDPHLGVSMVVGPNEVSDVNGQRCLAPDIVADHDRGQLRLGDTAIDSLDRLTITCKGQAFASYFLLPGRKLDAAPLDAGAPDVPSALVANRPEAQYLLERADQVVLRQATIPINPGTRDAMSAHPVSVVQPMVPSTPTATPDASSQMLHAPLVLAPEPPVPVTEPVPVAKPAAKKDAKPAETASKKKPAVTAVSGVALPASGMAVHLASYAGISAAKRGWKILLGEFDVLDPLAPLYVNVDIPGKGQMIRLYATGGDRASLQKVCTVLQAKGSYCVLSR